MYKIPHHLIHQGWDESRKLSLFLTHQVEVEDVEADLTLDAVSRIGPPVEIGTSRDAVNIDTIPCLSAAVILEYSLDGIGEPRRTVSPGTNVRGSCSNGEI